MTAEEMLPIENSSCRTYSSTFWEHSLGAVKLDSNMALKLDLENLAQWTLVVIGIARIPRTSRQCYCVQAFNAKSLGRMERGSCLHSRSAVKARGHHDYVSLCDSGSVIVN